MARALVGVVGRIALLGCAGQGWPGLGWLALAWLGLAWLPLSFVGLGFAESRSLWLPAACCMGA